MSFRCLSHKLFVKHIVGLVKRRVCMFCGLLFKLQLFFLHHLKADVGSECPSLWAFVLFCVTLNNQGLFQCVEWLFT